MQQAEPAKNVVIGIDVGGTNLRFALVRGNGEIAFRHREPTRIQEGWKAFLHRVLAGISLLVDQGREIGLLPSAVGVGVPGLIDREGVVRSSVNLLPLEGRNIVQALSHGAGLPVVAVNDANAIAFGEKRFGAGRSFSSFLLLTLGTGVGSGLVLDGRLWSGGDGFAAEYGHATVEPEGFPCGCGNRGCLEQYASATAIVRLMRQGIEAREGTPLSPRTGADLTAEHVAAAAAAGDPLARSIFERAGCYLGIAAASAVNLLNLDSIIVAGGVAASATLLMDAMRREIDRRAFDQMAARVRLLTGELGDDAGLLGSAALAMEASSQTHTLLEHLA